MTLPLVIPGSYEPLDLEPTQQGRNDQLAELVTNRMKYSEQDSWRTRQALPGYYDAYRGVLLGRTHSFANNVNVPSLFATIESSTARVMKSIAVGQPIQFVGDGSDGSSLIARKQQALYYKQFREDSGLLRAYQIIKYADLYGASPVELGWKYMPRPGVEFQMVRSPLDGKMYKVGRPKTFVDFDGPSMRLHDLLDFFPQPGRVHPRDWDWAISRGWYELDQVEAMVASGELSNRAEFMRLKREGGMTEQLEDDIRQIRGMRVLNGSLNSNVDPYGKPVQLARHVGWIPAELAPDGIPFRLIVVANGKYVLENMPFPWAHGRLDYVFMAYAPHWDPHYFFAPGKIEIGLPLALTANKLINHVLDSTDLAISPWMFINDDAIADPRSLALRPGRIIAIRGNPSESVMPGQFNMAGMQWGTSAAQMMDQMIQKGTGIIEDVVQGMPGNRETARGALMRSEAAGTRLDNHVLLLEELLLVPHADACMELNRQFLDSDQEAMMLGSAAKVDPVTGQPIPPGGMITVSPSDVMPRLRAVAVGSSQRMARAMAQQNGMMMMNTAFNAAKLGGPAMLGQLNLLGWLRWLGNLFDQGADVNDLIHQDPNRAAAQAAAIMEGNGAGIQAMQAQQQQAQEGFDGNALPQLGAPGQAMTPGGLPELAGSFGGGLQ